jgi:hypothetical protein
MLQCDYAFLNGRKIRSLIFDKCKYNDKFSGFRFFSLNVGEAMLSDCGRPFHSTLSLVSVMAW